MGGGGTVEQRVDRDRGPAATSTIRPLSFAWPLLGPIGLFPVSMGFGLALQPTSGN